MPEIEIEQNIPQINIDTGTRTYHLPIASATTLGGIKVGDNLTIESDGTLNAEATEYELPVATSSTLGGIKVGAALAIADGVLSVNSDQALNSNSTNPVRNSVVTSNFTSIQTDLAQAVDDITTLSNNYTTLNSTVGGHTTSITNLVNDVEALSTTVGNNSSDISDNATAIGNLSNTVNSLSNNVTTLSGNYDSLSYSVNELSSDVTLLKQQNSVEITHSYLIPVSTWTGGSINLEKRGKMATLSFNLEGTLNLHNTDVQIYTLLEHVPNADTYGTLLTDAGAIICKVDTDGIISLMNPEGDNKTVTKVLGQLTLVYQ